jgi:hypothetical protein
MRPNNSLVCKEVGIGVLHPPDQIGGQRLASNLHGPGQILHQELDAFRRSGNSFGYCTLAASNVYYYGTWMIN